MRSSTKIRAWDSKVKNRWRKNDQPNKGILGLIDTERNWFTLRSSNFSISPGTPYRISRKPSYFNAMEGLIFQNSPDRCPKLASLGSRRSGHGTCNQMPYKNYDRGVIDYHDWPTTSSINRLIKKIAALCAKSDFRAAGYEPDPDPILNNGIIRARTNTLSSLPIRNVRLSAINPLTI